MIVGFGPPVGISYPGRRPNSIEYLTSFVAGLHDGHAVAHSTGRLEGVQIDLTPTGAFTLFGVPMHTLGNRVIELETLVGGFWPGLRDRLYESRTWDERFRLLDSLIASRVASGSPASPAIARALCRLGETQGQLTIGALADELGASRQYLFNKFQDEVGLPPKTVARILRLENAICLLGGNGQPRLVEVAHASGYYDQAHFNRDFLAFSGTTPTDFLARRLPNGAGVRGGSAPPARR
jgi:AraC-like DNA-binding protein